MQGQFVSIPLSFLGEKQLKVCNVFQSAIIVQLPIRQVEND